MEAILKRCNAYCSNRNSDAVTAETGILIHRFVSNPVLLQFVDSTPQSNFAYMIYGKVNIVSGGSYTLCSASKDGYAVACCGCL